VCAQNVAPVGSTQLSTKVYINPACSPAGGGDIPQPQKKNRNSSRLSLVPVPRVSSHRNLGCGGLRAFSAPSMVDDLEEIVQETTQAGKFWKRRSHPVERPNKLLQVCPGGRKAYFSEALEAKRIKTHAGTRYHASTPMSLLREQGTFIGSI
jgi:hypothetical protein